MKTKGLGFILSILIISLFSIGLASFNLENNDTRYDFQVDETGENYITLNYNDGITPEHKVYFEGSTISINSFMKYPTPQNSLNHTFIGWYTTKSGFNEDGTSSKYNEEELSSGSTLYAKYINNSNESITSNNQIPLTISPSNLGSSSNNQYYYFSGFSDSTPILETIITKKGSLNVNSSLGAYSDGSQGTDQQAKLPSEADLILVLDSDLVIEGEVNISAVLGGSTGNLQAMITDNFSAIDLNGYTITIRNGGSLNGYGMIYNSQDTGGIIVENGSITTPFVVYGFKGGGLTGWSWASALSPFSNFLCPYLSCEILFTSGGRLVGKTSLYANDDENVTTINLVGNSEDYLVQINRGFLIRRQTNYLKYVSERLTLNNTITTFYDLLDANYRENFIFTNNPSEKIKYLDKKRTEYYVCDRADININTLDMPIETGLASLNVSMKYVDFPIPSFFDIEFYNSNIYFGLSLAFMPSSTCFIDENSTLNFLATDGGSKYTYDIFARISTIDHYYTSLNYKYVNGDNTSTVGMFNQGNPSIYISQGLMNSTKPAEVTIEGLINFGFNSSYSSSKDALYSIYSIGGRVNLSQESLNEIFLNSEKINIYNSYCNYTYFTPGSRQYYFNICHYFTYPLISNDKAYIQLDLNTNDGEEKYELVECDSFDLNNQLYTYQNKTYFYNFINPTTNLACGGIWGLTSYTECPGETNTNNKLNNLYGVWTECEKGIVNDNKNYVYYIKTTQNGVSTYYIKMAGAYLKCDEEPQLNELNKMNDVSITENGKFNADGSSGYTIGSTAYFDYDYFNEWRFNYE